MIRPVVWAAGGEAAAAPASGAPSDGARPAPVTEFRSLRGGVGIFTGRGGTIGWLANRDALVAVDTQFPDTAAIFLSGLPERGDRPLDVVLNTHHHGDHTGGNGVLKPVSRTLVAHANVPKLMFEAAERAGSAQTLTYPDTTFTEVWRRDFGREIVTAQYFGPAHTKGDVVVHFEKANVVHLGDIVFNRLYPVIDRPGGASIRGWIARLGEILKTYPADAVYVFGHGRKEFGVTGGPADIALFRDYLGALLDHVSRRIAAGETREKIVAIEQLPGFETFHAPPPNRLGANLGAAFDELVAAAEQTTPSGGKGGGT